MAHTFIQSHKMTHLVQRDLFAIHVKECVFVLLDPAILDSYRNHWRAASLQRASSPESLRELEAEHRGRESVIHARVRHRGCGVRQMTQALWRTWGSATRSQPHSEAFSLKVYVPNEHNGQIHGTLSAYRS